MNEQLMQNRIVIVGRDHRETTAYYQDHERFKDCIDSPVMITSASHRLTLQGSLGGMHVGTFYLIGHARQGENFPIVEELMGRARGRNPRLQVVDETVVDAL